MAGMTDGKIDTSLRLRRHLQSWVGEWPPPGAGIHVVGDPARLEPTWDGSMRLLQGVSDGHGAVLAVPPVAVEAVTTALAQGTDRPGLGDELGEILGVGPARFGRGVFRWSTSVDSGLTDLGQWFEDQVDGLPEWLAPFNGPRLVAFADDGAPLAGVGIKIHDRFGYELAVVTEEVGRGRGLARRLVATAAHWVLDHGAVPTYLHHPSNVASAHVAEAVGFPDRGWAVYGLWPQAATDEPVT